MPIRARTCNLHYLTDSRDCLDSCTLYCVNLQALAVCSFTEHMSCWSPLLQGGMMEEWHQKLHNNTSPDDVIICQALLAYLEQDLDISCYWQTLQVALHPCEGQH